MSAMTSSHDTRTLQARPAGAAERPMMNENVVELVRFFQASNASPVSPVSPVLPQNASASNIFKAGHRRLRQLTMRQKKDSDSKSKPDDSYRHLMSVQRGELPAVSKTKSSQLKGSFEPNLSHSRSLDTMFTNSKSEVENIGQPWLEDTFERKDMEDQRAHRLSPLDLEEFTSMIKAAESSCTLGRDETPPSYEQSIQSRPSNCSTQPPATTENHNPAARSSGESPYRSGFLDNDTAGTVQSGENGNSAQPSETTNVSSSHQQSEGNGHSRDDYFNEITALPSEADHQHGSSAAEKSKQQSSENHGASGYAKRPSSSASIPERTSQPLKLFPEPPPPRTSSRGMWKAQDSRRPSLASSAASDERKCLPSVTEARSGSPMPLGNVLSHKDPIPRPHTTTDTRQVAIPSKEHTKSDDKNGGPAFLPMEEINAFPLPAPNRPPPELPKAGSTKESHKNRIENFNKSVVPANTNPRYLRQLSRLPSASGWKMLNENAARSSSPMPAACSGALPVQRGSSAGQDGASQGASSDQPSMAVTPQSRAEKVRALRMKDISQRRQQLKTRNLHHEDSTPALPQADSIAIERRNHDLKLDTGRRLQRIVAPAPTSPPPASPLPLDPPIRPPNADSYSRRYRSSPSSIKMPISRSAATSPDLGRSPQIKRSDSTRSASICHDIISNEKKSFDYSDSPIPSSDDEGRGTARSSRAFSSRRARRSARRSDSSALRITPHTRKQLHSDFIPPLSPRSEATTKSPPQSPRSDYTFRSTEHSASVIQALETRVANLERQNKILQAALTAALDASGHQMPDGLFNSLASFSGSKASPDTGRSVSSFTSNSSSMDESAWSMKQGKANLKSSSASRLDKWHATRDSSSFSSLESSMKGDGSHAKELEHAMRDLEYGWLPSVGEAQDVRNPQSL
ncbi:hypothetical protein PHISCL_03143 [Aspergillus sclerotialis]|uniref:Uncharacterized protein n=1 Tax=Aspergillus sclerotialis TaxID=2070753 RepID=A0A3A3A3A0_9EURO|nr:hypothetical protein PHISCL_03143 [Aspergillus sclerotialis]